MWVVSYTKELVFAVVIKLGKQLEIQNKVNEKLNGKGEMSKHLQSNCEYESSGIVLTKAPSNFSGRKIWESCFFKQLNPLLNDERNKNILMLFSHGVV